MTHMANVNKDRSILKGKKVLLVDDNARNLFSLTAVLKKYKLSLLIAESGQKALDTLQKESDIDIVLMDIMMPVMDGYEAIQRIRQNNISNNTLPIIALTANAMSGDREKCLQSGADDYITKPVDVNLLLDKMQHCFMA